MLKQLIDLYGLLAPSQKRKLLQLQILVMLMAFAELASVVAIGPFMALISDPSVLSESGFIAQVYILSGLSDPKLFMFWLGVGMLLVLAFSTVISVFALWRLSMYGAQVGAEIGNRLYSHYMHQNWLFHAGGSSSQLTNKIAQETNRLTDGVINPFMQLNSRIVLVCLMSIALVIYNPVVALVGVSLFGGSYLLLFRFIRSKVVKNGRVVTAAQKQRFKMMGEGFGGVKDVILLGRQEIFTQQFESASYQMAAARGKNRVMGQCPRYIMEMVAFGAIIFLVLYLLSSNDGDIGAVVPILSVYALAGVKLLPAFQQVYASFSQIRGSLAAFEEIKPDLVASLPETINSDAHSENLVTIDKIKSLPDLSVRKSIRLKNVSFSYPGKGEPLLNELNLEMKANHVVGLVGASGSGKSTIIDLLLALLDPEYGEVLIDDKPINEANKRAWQNSVGFVPQSIFLSDSSIAENIAFGIPKNKIDFKKVNRAAEMAHLDELIDQLPEGMDTKVGERGVQLSGGQRQRIGIARALYNDPDVLVLDEATSALDGITEKLIMDAIHDFSGKKTIIMIAHRLSTVKKCDTIFLLDRGKVVDSGTYAELDNRNEIFRKMAEHA
ncbi:ABC transporter ATP-binding protein [Alcanivorax sp. NBRC 102028]|uniref:ABC transporter ATP-binding protein n=1 Tax=Alcanivorax sp. NBRC 102028 TaxID=1113897 RepID=UPI000789DAA7|nr:ABC transporter ATP-binding protein [Alcanivorax sp. NBRC 102028]